MRTHWLQVRDRWFVSMSTSRNLVAQLALAVATPNLYPDLSVATFAAARMEVGGDDRCDEAVPPPFEIAGDDAHVPRRRGRGVARICNPSSPRLRN